MSARVAIPLIALAVALSAAVTALILVDRRATEARRAHSDAARRLDTICNSVHGQLESVLRVESPETASEIALGLVSFIEPCADGDATKVAQALLLAATAGGRAAIDRAVEAALDAVPRR
jgi:hypothetical protein